MARSERDPLPEGRHRGRLPAPGSSVFSTEEWSSIAERCGLSARELDIVRGVFDAASEKEMAAHIGVSPHTVHTYLLRVYRKLRVRRREGVILAVFVALRSIRRDPHSLE